MAIPPSAAGADPGVRPRTRVRRLAARSGPALALIVVLGVAWEAAVRIGEVPAYLLPAPSEVWAAFTELRPRLGAHIVATATTASIGLLVAAVAGAALAGIIVSSRLVRRVVSPLLVVSQTIPMVVLAPLLIAWFGFGLGPKVAVVALVGTFPIVIATVEGVDRADRDVTELLRSLGAGRVDLVRHLLAPTALPSFFAGARIAATYAMVGAVVAEWMGASAGLGLLLTRSQASFRIDQVFVGIALIAAVSIALFSLVGLIGRLATPWITPHEDRR